MNTQELERIGQIEKQIEIINNTIAKLLDLLTSHIERYLQQQGIGGR